LATNFSIFFLDLTDFKKFNFPVFFGIELKLGAGVKSHENHPVNEALKS
jgi:hypothetical protein